MGIELDKNRKHTIEVVVDRLLTKATVAARLATRRAHREIDDQLARKISRNLGIPRPRT